MKKVPLFLLLLSMMLLAACSAPAAAASTTASAATSQQPQGGFDPAKMDENSKLVVGTLKLEGTDQSVTAEQAKQLLPLWKAVKSLGSSDTAAEAEIEALYSQIKENMTAEQIKAIQALELNQEDLSALMSDLGIEMAAPGDMPAVSEDQRATLQALRQSGGGNPGGGPEGGPGGMVIRIEGGPEGGPGGAGGPSFSGGPDVVGTPDPNSTRVRRTMGMSRLFLDPLIQMLTERAGA